MSFDEKSSLRRMSSIETKTGTDASTDEDDHKQMSTNGCDNQVKSCRESLELSADRKRSSMSSSVDNSLFSAKAIRCVVLWYFFSFTTLFLNKYIVSYERGDTTVLALFQLMSCAICSAFQLKLFANNQEICLKTSKKNG